MNYCFLPCQKPKDVELTPTAYPYNENAPTYPIPIIGNQLPTGFPVGQNVAPPPSIPNQTAFQVQSTMPQTLQDTSFIPGFLRTQIGQKMRVEFLIGTNAPLVDRTGTLLKVGANYILLRLIETDDVIMCDLYAIKFVTIML